MMDLWTDAVTQPPAIWSTVLGYGRRVGYAIVLYNSNNSWQDEFGNIMTITHWQPLPQEPK